MSLKYFRGAKTFMLGKDFQRFFYKYDGSGKTLLRAGKKIDLKISILQ